MHYLLSARCTTACLWNTEHMSHYLLVDSSDNRNSFDDLHSSRTTLTSHKLGPVYIPCADVFTAMICRQSVQEYQTTSETKYASAESSAREWAEVSARANMHKGKWSEYWEEAKAAGDMGNEKVSYAHIMYLSFPLCALLTCTSLDAFWQPYLEAWSTRRPVVPMLSTVCLHCHMQHYSQRVGACW